MPEAPLSRRHFVGAMASAIAATWIAGARQRNLAFGAPIPASTPPSPGVLSAEQRREKWQQYRKLTQSSAASSMPSPP